MDHSHSSLPSHSHLLEQVRKMNDMASTTKEPEPAFDFYDSSQMDDFSSSIEDLMYLITTCKAESSSTKTSLRKTKSLAKLKATQSQRLLMNKPSQHPQQWDRSIHVSASLLKSLRAPIDGDASHSLYSPFRDLPRTKEAQAALAKETLASFKPGEIGTMFGEPPIDSCAESFQEMLERHLTSTLERVKREYEGMPWATVAISELKGGVGRDLAALEERLRRVQGAMSVGKKRLPPIDRRAAPGGGGGGESGGLGDEREPEMEQLADTWEERQGEMQMM